MSRESCRCVERRRRRRLSHSLTHTDQRCRCNSWCNLCGSLSCFAWPRLFSTLVTCVPSLCHIVTSVSQVTLRPSCILVSVSVSVSVSLFLLLSSLLSSFESFLSILPHASLGASPIGRAHRHLNSLSPIDTLVSAGLHVRRFPLVSILDSCAVALSLERLHKLCFESLQALNPVRHELVNLNLVSRIQHPRRLAQKHTKTYVSKHFPPWPPSFLSAALTRASLSLSKRHLDHHHRKKALVDCEHYSCNLQPATCNQPPAINAILVLNPPRRFVCSD